MVNPDNRQTPSLPASVPRDRQRRALGIGDTLPFRGEDTWNAYEFTWLNGKGRPEVALARFRVPGDSANLIESRSLKLYLFSFSNTRFSGRDEVLAALETDLTRTAGAPVGVSLLSADEVRHEGMGRFSGVSLDSLDIETEAYDPSPDLLQVDSANPTEGAVHTDLFMSLCPLTGQPDFAGVFVRYGGCGISHESLLRYLVSYRRHAEFAEQVVERIFMDILHRCAPRRLAVTGRYTRRGGIDINAHRSLGMAPPAEVRLWRQ